MPAIAVLTESDLRRTVPLDLAAVDVVEGAFRALAGGKVVMPPVLSMAIAEFNGEVDVKTAYVPGLDAFALKVSPGFFDNPKQGLPSTSGLMILFSVRTGLLQALLLDNGYLTDIRTAAAGAVAARHLARADATRVAVLGAGTQARMQVEALCRVRPIASVRVWARSSDAARRLAAGLSADLGLGAAARVDARDAVAGADIVVTTTPATVPILMADWLEPGQHVTAMGSDQNGKGELDPACLTRADLYVPDRLEQTRIMGELQGAIAAGLVAPDASFPELGAVITGTAPGRTSPHQITVADLTGTGVQDTAIATHALARARNAGLGTTFES